jgi:hypothetical protein
VSCEYGLEKDWVLKKAVGFKGTTMNENFQHLDELFLDLKILAEVGQREKISTKTTKITVQPNGFFLACMRFVGRESRENNLERIKDLMIKVTRETKEFTSGRQINHVILERIRVHLINARKGVENLCYTYKNDVNMKSELGQQMDKLDDQVHTIHQFQQGGHVVNELPELVMHVDPDKKYN